MDRPIAESARAWCVALASLAPLGAHALSLPADVDLNSVQLDGTLAHERAPRGVPRGYDWAARPRVGAGNSAGTFRAATGWGQVFRNDDTKAVDAALQLRDLQVLLCSGPDHQWQMVQRGVLEGRQYRADFGGDLNRPARIFRQVNGYATVSIDAGTAFHFWPSQGRFDLPTGPLCGFVVLVQARLDPGSKDTDPGYLVGLGADYWLDRNARWDNFKTNRDVAIGRLREATADWRWYGLSTAGDADLQRLRSTGYALSAALCAAAGSSPCR